MHSSGSVWKTIVEKVRIAMNLSNLDGKYSDADLMSYYVGSAHADVMARIQMTSQIPVTADFTLTLAVGTEFYTLPPAIRRIIRIAKWDADGILENDAGPPLSEYSPFGPGWQVEGNTLRIRPFPTTVETWTIKYVPSGDTSYFYGDSGSTGASVSADGLTVTLSNTPSLGSIDRRTNSYAGSVVRLIGTHSIEERVIASDALSSSTRTLTLRLPLSATFQNTTQQRYEIVPLYASEAFVNAITHAVCRELCPVLGVPGTRSAQYELNYRNAIKTIRDEMCNKIANGSESFDPRTIYQEKF